MTKIGVICDFQKKPVLGANLGDQKKKWGRHVRTVIFTDCWSSFVLTYRDRKGLDPQQAAFATRIYKQHHHVGTMAEVLEAMHLQEERKKALANL